MNALPVPLFLAVEHGVLVAWQHLSLGRHLGLPRLERLERLPLPREGLVEGVDHGVDGPEALPLAGFLEPRQPPGDLPVYPGTSRC